MRTAVVAEFLILILASPSIFLRAARFDRETETNERPQNTTPLHLHGFH
jgi:hypothetical protein